MNTDSTNQPAAQPEVTPAPAAAPVANRAGKPKGVLPKNLQSWAWLAVLLVVAVGIFFSGATPQKWQPAAPINPQALHPLRVD